MFWAGERDGYGPPDLVIKAPEYTMPAVHQDEWWRPVSDIPVTEPPLGPHGRDSSDQPGVAQDPASLDRLPHPEPRELRCREPGHRWPSDPLSGSAAQAAADLVNRRPQLMEWAIGKGYDRYLEGTGKLIMPGEKISWDQHIPRRWRRSDGGSEIGLWLYKKGEEPKKRSYLVGFTGLKNGTAGLDIPPNSVAATEGFTVLRENTIITNFQPHFHLRGKAMQVEAIFPDGRTQVVSYVKDFNFNWMTNYIYTDEAAPVFRRHRSSMSAPTTTTRRRTSRTPTRNSGWATATARLTKWRTRG